MNDTTKLIKLLDVILGVYRFDAWDFENWLNFCPNSGADMRKVVSNG